MSALLLECPYLLRLDQQSLRAYEVSLLVALRFLYPIDLSYVLALYFTELGREYCQNLVPMGLQQHG
jgi:hypothetical protein